MAKINQHVSLGEKNCKSTCLLCLLIVTKESSHHFIFVSYLYLRVFVSLLAHLTSIKTTGLWVDLVSPNNVELWCSVYHSLTLESVMSFLT